jgi:hypothetical protein
MVIKHVKEKPPKWFPQSENDAVRTTANLVKFAIRDMKKRRYEIQHNLECLDRDIAELESELQRMVEALEGRPVTL